MTVDNRLREQLISGLRKEGRRMIREKRENKIFLDKSIPDDRLISQLKSGLRNEGKRTVREKSQIEKKGISTFNLFIKNRIKEEEKSAYARVNPTPKSRLKEAYKKGGVKEVAKEGRRISREKFTKKIVKNILDSKFSNKKIIKSSNATINVARLLNQAPAEYRSNVFKEELMKDRRLFFK